MLPSLPSRMTRHSTCIYTTGPRTFSSSFEHINQEVFQLNAEEQTATVTLQICCSSALAGEASEEHTRIDKRERKMIPVTEEEELRQIHASFD